jgi:hypothetical protein
MVFASRGFPAHNPGNVEQSQKERGLRRTVKTHVGVYRRARNRGCSSQVQAPTEYRGARCKAFVDIGVTEDSFVGL